MSHKISAQMYGHYNVGPQNSDFTSIQEAINRLQSEGVSDTVFINIQDGTYLENLTFGNTIPFINPSKPVYFESISKDPAKVVITSSMAKTLSISNQSFLHFQYLTFRNTRDHNDTYTVQIYKSQAIAFFQCIIALDCPLPAKTSSTSAVLIERIDHPPTTGKIILENCQFTGNGCGMKLFANKNMVQITNSTFDHLGKYSVYADFTDSLDFIHNQFYGEIETFQLNSVKFHSNIAHAETHIIGEFINNTFYHEANLSGSLVENNIFHFIADLYMPNIRNNTFFYTLHMSYIDSLQFCFNTCFGKFDVAFCQQAIINANYFKKEAHMAFCYGSLVSNNIFLKEFNAGISDYCKIYHNNFGPEAYLRITSFEGKIKNNNFSQEIYFENFLPIIEQNNYYPKGGDYDSNPFSISPDYVDSSLIASNPKLTGKGLFLPEIHHDINGQLRSNPPTIGANEICSTIDTLEVNCYQPLILDMCSLPNDGHFTWTPSRGLDNAHIRNPTAVLDSSIVYTVIDSVTGFKDSLIILIIPFKNHLIEDSFLLRCGQQVQFATYSLANAHWHWDPKIGLSNDTIRNPIAQPFTSTVYHLELSVPGCPVYIDSVVVQVDPRPISAFYPEGESSIVHCRNHSTCADSYVWIFNDGYTTVEFEPIHEYTSSGLYEIILIATNASGQDTSSAFVYIIISDVEHVSSQAIPKPYPNPATGSIHFMSNTYDLSLLQVEFYSSSGRLVLHQSNLSTAIETATFPAGEYFYRLFENQKVLGTGIWIKQ